MKTRWRSLNLISMMLHFHFYKNQITASVYKYDLAQYGQYCLHPCELVKVGDNYNRKCETLDWMNATSWDFRTSEKVKGDECLNGPPLTQEQIESRGITKQNGRLPCPSQGCYSVLYQTLEQMDTNGDPCVTVCDKWSVDEDLEFRCMNPTGNFVECSPHSGVTANGQICKDPCPSEGKSDRCTTAPYEFTEFLGLKKVYEWDYCTKSSNRFDKDEFQSQTGIQFESPGPGTIITAMVEAKENDYKKIITFWALPSDSFEQLKLKGLQPLDDTQNSVLTRLGKQVVTRWYLSSMGHFGFFGEAAEEGVFVEIIRYDHNAKNVVLVVHWNDVKNVPGGVELAKAIIPLPVLRKEPRVAFHALLFSLDWSKVVEVTLDLEIWGQNGNGVNKWKERYGEVLARLNVPLSRAEMRASELKMAGPYLNIFKSNAKCFERSDGVYACKY